MRCRASIARQRQAGVVAFSSGNHAQAIALSARLLGMPATIVMPHDAPAAKVAATRGYGGTVVSTTATARTAKRSAGASPKKAA
jgi:threonine dehydratase